MLYIGSILSYHVHRTPYETDDKQSAADFILHWEYIEAQQEEERDGAREELKTQKEDHKSGIDWFIYGERILNPLLFPFAVARMRQTPELFIIEDNASAYKHYYHTKAREELGLKKIIWPSSSPDLNLIETIWSEMKEKIKEKLGWNFTAGAIQELVEQKWKQYPVERANHYIMSMSRRIEACIADDGGNNFDF